MSNFSSSQEMILRLKTEEFTLWRQTITLSASFIGFPAALLGTNNLHSVNVPLLSLSWVFFMVNIILGTILMKHILALNISLSWFSGYKSSAQESLSTLNKLTHNQLVFEEDGITHESAPKEFIDYKANQKEILTVSCRKEKEASDALNSRLIKYGIHMFYISFVIALLIMSTSILNLDVVWNLFNKLWVQQ